MRKIRVLVGAVALSVIAAGASITSVHAEYSRPVVTAAARPLAAPNGIDYGSTGAGNPSTADCTRFVDSGSSINTAIGAARSGDVICVRAGNYSSELVTLNKSGVTVRSNGTAKIKGADIRGDGSTLDGFTVVGGGFGDPRSGVRFAGDGIKVLNNLITGGNLEYGISCDKGQCNNGLVAHNSVTEVPRSFRTAY